MTTEAVSWMKLPIIGMPGTECGRKLVAGGDTVIQQDFKDEYGACDEPARWSVGMLLLCQEHARIVAAEFGDDIAEIEAAWHSSRQDAWYEECLPDPYGCYRP